MLKCKQQDANLPRALPLINKLLLMKEIINFALLLRPPVRPPFCETFSRLVYSACDKQEIKELLLAVHTLGLIMPIYTV